MVLSAVAGLLIAACTNGSVATGTARSNATIGPPATQPSRSGAPIGSAGTHGSPGTLNLGSLAVTLEPFTTVQGSPLAIAAPDDGSGRLFVVGQDGRIWVVEADGTASSEPLVDLRDHLVSGGEQGLLGLALHPGFPKDPRVYVNYTNRDGDSVIASLTLDPANPNRLDPASERQILFVDQPYANHNGGDLLFGPDGYLYAFFGDGGSGGDPQGNGQNRNVLLGKVLRLDVDHPGGDVPYSIPAGNPFSGGGGRGEIWLYGVRNPWRN